MLKKHLLINNRQMTRSEILLPITDIFNLLDSVNDNLTDVDGNQIYILWAPIESDTDWDQITE